MSGFEGLLNAGAQERLFGVVQSLPVPGLCPLMDPRRGVGDDIAKSAIGSKLSDLPAAFSEVMFGYFALFFGPHSANSGFLVDPFLIFPISQRMANGIVPFSRPPAAPNACV